MADATPMPIDGEQWLPVVGWEGWYEVSDHGRVRRVAPRPRGGRAEQLLAGSTNRKGYQEISLRRHGQQRKAFIHQLVLQAFVGPKPAGQECNHKDGDKQHNRLSNLEWVTPKGNTDHAAKTGLRPVLLKNMVGQRFGRLVVTGRGESPRREAYWICECDCGNTTTVGGNNLRRGRTTSCGCLRADWARENQELLISARRHRHDQATSP